MSPAPDIHILDPLVLPEYDALLLATPGHSFFHSSLWARVLSDSYGYRPVYFASMSEGRFNALMPVMEVKSVLTGLRGVSLPFS
ncbi:MAG: methicillin resistance protein, partial [Chloroflexota bacterium]